MFVPEIGRKLAIIIETCGMFLSFFWRIGSEICFFIINNGFVRGRESNKMKDILKKVCKIVGGFTGNVLLCSAKPITTAIMQIQNAYFYSYYYFAWQG